MKKTPTEILARKIAVSLFTDGEGQRADRLQLMIKQGSTERDRGGWGFLYAIDQIERTIVASGFTDMPSNPLKPGLSLLCKLGSITIHADKGHGFDKIALEGCLKDREVQEWLKAMGVYLPLKR